MIFDCYEGGRICGNKPVRADYLDTVVWNHITALLADPRLIHAEIDKRLTTARTTDPVARQRKTLNTALAKAGTAITRMIEAFGEGLITIDALRDRMPDLRARETNLRNQFQALDAQHADREAYLTPAANLHGFLSQLRHNAETTTVHERRRVLRPLVKDVLVGGEKITTQHRIPIRDRTTSGRQNTPSSDTEGDHPQHCQLRWGRARAALRRCGPFGGRWPWTSSPQRRELDWRMALTHKEIFEQYMYAGAITRNPDAIAAMFTEDGVLDAPLVPDGHPLHRRLVGRDAIRTGISVYQQQPTYQGTMNVERSAYVLHDTADPDVFMAEIDVAFDEADGRRTTMSLVQIFRLRDGQIAMLRDYFSELPAVVSDGHSS